MDYAELYKEFKAMHKEITEKVDDVKGIVQDFKESFIEHKTSIEGRVSNVENEITALKIAKKEEKNKSWDVGKSILVGIIVAMFGGMFVYYLNNRQPDNSKMIEVLEKLNNTLKPKTEK